MLYNRRKSIDRQLSYVASIYIVELVPAISRMSSVNGIHNAIFDLSKTRNMDNIEILDQVMRISQPSWIIAIMNNAATYGRVDILEYIV